MVTPTFVRASSHECPPLQAADAIAWTTGRHMRDTHRDPTAKERPELIRLRRKVRILGGSLNMATLMEDVDARVARLVAGAAPQS